VRKRTFPLQPVCCEGEAHGRGQENGQKSSPVEVLEKHRARVRLLIRVRTCVVWVTRHRKAAGENFFAHGLFPWERSEKWSKILIRRGARETQG